MPETAMRTPLYDIHKEFGAHFVNFAGWEMPIRYGSIVEEHHRVRTSGGLFDVSHMGRLKITGKDATRLLDRVTTRPIASMEQGQCRYCIVTNDAGGARDDVIVSRFDEDDYLVVVNASNREKIVAHLHDVGARENLRFDLKDQTLDTAMIAVQGPKVMDFIGRFSGEITSLKKYRFLTKNLMLFKVIVSRTGYTGEDGVEVIMPRSTVSLAFKMLKDDLDLTREDAILAPIGLGARDTLRLEAAMPLYGHELAEDISVLSSGMDFAIKLDKSPEFIGQDALNRQRERGGPPRIIVGLDVDGRRTPRGEMPVLRGDRPVGIVTSGCLSPTLDRPIALALVDREHAAEGTELEIDAGRARMAARVRPLPFYKAPAR